jgi:phospholipid/cholesterol/gamma-HCH transport system permease protein
LNLIIENIKSYLKENNCEIETIDIRKLENFDTSGAYVVCRLIGCEKLPKIIGNHDNFERLLGEIQKQYANELITPDETNVFDLIVGRIANAIKLSWSEFVSTISFIGATIYALFISVFSPQKVRWTQTVAIMESAGFNAIPIVFLLTFFIGVVITIMGAQTLQSFGASVFAVELLGWAVLREFAVLITAIILAGRSASAFTAQLGSMKMTQEVDAMAVMGLEPMEVLVIPRVLALLFMMPILVFFAMVAGLLGGALVSMLTLDMSMQMFLTRLQENVGPRHFWVGMAKVPIMASVIAIIGCRKGLEVENDVISLGKNTTAAVVQAIFMVIVIDAIFAMIYNELAI